MISDFCLEHSTYTESTIPKYHYMKVFQKVLFVQCKIYKPFSHLEIEIVVKSNK